MKTFEVKIVSGVNKFDTVQIQAEKAGERNGVYEFSTHADGVVYAVKLDYLVSAKQVNGENPR